MRLVLPSNSSLEYFPNNTLTEYTVKLPQNLDLSKGRWEVGLQEVMFFKSWYNVKDASFTVYTKDNECTVTIPDGYYNRPQRLIQVLNKFSRIKFSDLITFHYEDVSRQCIIDLKPMDYESIQFSPNLSNILGKPDLNCAPYTVKYNGGRHGLFKSKSAVKLNTIFNLMIYTDITTESIVGDIESSLLRSVAVEDGHWKMQCTNFNNVQYLPVSKQQISTITIYIYTDYGEKVPFEDGRVVCTLDIRQTSPLYE